MGHVRHTEDCEDWQVCAVKAGRTALWLFALRGTCHLQRAITFVPYPCAGKVDICHTMTLCCALHICCFRQL